MKKRIWTMTLVVLVVLSLVTIGCPPPAPVPEVVPPIEVIHWVGQTRVPAGVLMYEALVRISERITEASGGRLVLTPHPGGAIVPAKKELEGVEKGVLDFAITCYMYWVGRWPAAGLFTMRSGGMSPTEKYIWFHAGGGAELAQQMLEGTNVKILPVAEVCPPEIFLHTNVPLREPADLKGLKSRAVGDGAAILARLGAVIVPMPVGEVFEAMHLGVIDAFEAASPVINWGLGLQEVARYLYLSPTRQPYETNPFLINRDRWEELPRDLQVIVEEVVRTEAMRYYAYAIVLDLEALQKFKDFGVIVKTLPPTIEDAIQKAAVEFYAELAAKCAFAAKVLQSQIEFQEAFRAAWERP
jgi:TRAP-type mannitol/chloroaromatic compound transport system substrate-binding protein